MAETPAESWNPGNSSFVCLLEINTQNEFAGAITCTIHIFFSTAVKPNFITWKQRNYNSLKQDKRKLPHPQQAKLDRTQRVHPGGPKQTTSLKRVNHLLKAFKRHTQHPYPSSRKDILHA